MRNRSGLSGSPSTLPCTFAPSLCLWLLLITLPARAPAGGVVNSCTEADLRAALAGGGLVTFACDGIIILTSTITISTNTVLDATGRDVTISGGNAVRVFDVASSVEVTVVALKVSDGRHAAEGAGILNAGTLMLRGCTFSNNVVIGGGFLRGGALLNIGTADVVDCTFVTNRAEGPGYGGAIHNNGVFSVRQCTFADNESGAGGGAIANWIATAGQMRAGVTNSTFWRNKSPIVGGAGIYNYRAHNQVSGQLSVLNCTFVDNAGATVSGSPLAFTWVANTVLGYAPNSIFQDGGNNLFWTTPENAIDLRLGQLGPNGGPTWTVALQPDSPAIDQGNDAYCPPTDQRGIARPFGPRCDIGAYESTASPPVTLFQFSAAMYSTNEGASFARVTVIRTGSSAGGGSVRYSVSSGTATAFHDFTAGSGTLSFASGQTALTFTVPIKDDHVPESDETVLLALSQLPGQPGVGEPSTAVLTIIDNDPVQPGALAFTQPGYSVSEDSSQPRIWVTRTGGTNGSVTVDYATGDG